MSPFFNVNSWKMQGSEAFDTIRLDVSNVEQRLGTNERSNSAPLDNQTQFEACKLRLAHAKENILLSVELATMLPKELITIQLPVFQKQKMKSYIF